MERVGPPLELLTRRLTDTPSEFMSEPAVGALVNDLLHRLGRRLGHEELVRYTGPLSNRQALVTVAVWLLADEWFMKVGVDRAATLRFLDQTIGELASSGVAARFVDDPDRREELARTALARLGYRPEGESIGQATDRLSAVSGTERRRLLAASREAEERARVIREALAKKAAEESADKWTRE